MRLLRPNGAGITRASASLAGVATAARTISLHETASTSGEHLERAIWHETPAPLQRSLALDMLRDRGARLNHRVASVLRVIAANPSLSNNDIALRVHIEGKGDASRLLARLARFGLIENTRTGGRENEWQLTPSGVELATAIRDETRRVK